MHAIRRHPRVLFGALATSLICASPALAQPLALFEPQTYPNTVFQQVMPAEREQALPRYETPRYETPRYETPAPADETNAALPAHLRRQIVNYPTREAPGTIVIDTPNTYLYYVLGGGRAIRYGIGVGREGFTWAGVQSVARKQEWPDWHPPQEMIERQPYLPRFMAGGIGNPLGARAMYLGNSLYRIHGTNAPSTIGQRVSSGCIRLTNEDVQDLYERVTLGTKVVVLPDSRHRAPANVASTPAPQRVSRNAVAPGSVVVEPDEPAAYEPVYVPRPQVGIASQEPVTFRANPYFGAGASRIY